MKNLISKLVIIVTVLVITSCKSKTAEHREAVVQQRKELGYSIKKINYRDSTTLYFEIYKPIILDVAFRGKIRTISLIACESGFYLHNDDGKFISHKKIKKGYSITLMKKNMPTLVDIETFSDEGVQEELFYKDRMYIR